MEATWQASLEKPTEGATRSSGQEATTSDGEVHTGLATSQGQANDIWSADAAYVNSIAAQLPIAVLDKLLLKLVPMLDDFCEHTDHLNDKLIMTHLESTTLVGLVPLGAPIPVHRYQDNTTTELWFSAYMWGSIFVRHLEPPARIFHGLQQIQLFKLSSKQ
ncbi:hypothetical protein CYMTET_48063 [Cymbomonas tetramitiformis]|uniref:Uncharacterized protein n=1 Tax=Cymbomonas tetramitiformis TaxID=36881 RepID=A0AAE0BT13_9CHLO|nr:hypothetical protein CYMTET_48063 [Cymbomonas tetramitiformis]